MWLTSQKIFLHTFAVFIPSQEEESYPTSISWVFVTQESSLFNERRILWREMMSWKLLKHYSEYYIFLSQSLLYLMYLMMTYVCPPPPQDSLSFHTWLTDTCVSLFTLFIHTCFLCNSFDAIADLSSPKRTILQILLRTGGWITLYTPKVCCLWYQSIDVCLSCLNDECRFSIMHIRVILQTLIRKYHLNCNDIRWRNPFFMTTERKRERE